MGEPTHRVPQSFAFGSHSIASGRRPRPNQKRSRARAIQDEKRLSKVSGQSLAKHIYSLLDDSEFSDLVIECGSFRWYCHLILLLARVPRLHSVLLCRFRLPSVDHTCIRLPIEVLGHFDLDSFLRCVYSGQDVSVEQSLLLDLLRQIPDNHKHQQSTDAFGLDLQLMNPADSMLAEPLYANLAEVQSPAQEEEKELKKLIDLAGNLNPNDDLIDLKSQPKSIDQSLTAVEEEDDVKNCLNSVTDSGRPDSENILIKVEKDDDDADQVNVEVGTTKSGDCASRTGHTMSDVNELMTECQSAQQIVDRILQVDRSIDCEPFLDPFEQALVSQLCSDSPNEPTATISVDTATADQPIEYDEETEHVQQLHQCENLQTLISESKLIAAQKDASSIESPMECTPDAVNASTIGSMIRSSTFDLLSFKGKKVCKPSDCEQLIEQESERTSSRQSDHLLQRHQSHPANRSAAFERPLIEKDRTIRTASAGHGKPAKKRVQTRSGWIGPQGATSEDLSGSDLEAVRKGFMFISIEDELPSLDAALAGTQFGTFERQKASGNGKAKQSSSNRLQSTDTENDEDQKLLQSSLLSCSKLGEDLLWLFLLQTDCDMHLLVDEGKRSLGAHQCILAARSEYLRKQLIDRKVAATVLPLENGAKSCTDERTHEDYYMLNCLSEFSFPAVHFALCHIYSGTVVLPNFVHTTFHAAAGDRSNGKGIGSSRSALDCDSATAASATNSLPYDHVPLAELLHLCDLLQLPHLRQAVVSAIRHHLCHQFHAPCDRCVTGVCQAVQLAERCDLGSLHSSCVRWLAKYLPAVCSSTPFLDLLATERPLTANRKSTLSRPTSGSIGKRPKLSVRLLEAIQERINDETVLDIGVSLLRAKQQTSGNYVQSDQLHQLLVHAIDSCATILVEQFDVMLCSESFHRLLQQPNLNPEPVQQLLFASIDRLDAEQACRGACALEQLFALYDPNERPGQSCFRQVGLDEAQLHLLRQTRKRVERVLIQNVDDVVRCESWSLLSVGMQRHIQDAAMLVFEFDKPTAKRPQLSSSARRSTRSDSTASSTCGRPDAASSNNHKISKCQTAARPGSTRSNKSFATGGGTSRRTRPETRSNDSATAEAKRTANQGQNKRTVGSSCTAEDESEPDAHIYDEVPVEDATKSLQKTVDWCSKPSLQVAKVSPFRMHSAQRTVATVDQSTFESEDAMSSDAALASNSGDVLYENLRSDKEGDESNPIRSTSMNLLLQQAEQLQQRLNQRVNHESPARRNKSSSNASSARHSNTSRPISSQTQRSRPNGTSSTRASSTAQRSKGMVQQSLNRRPPFK